LEALSAAVLIAISPGAVYLSRYFIHESLFVFFTLGIVVAALKYYDTGRGDLSDSGFHIRSVDERDQGDLDHQWPGAFDPR